MRHSEVYNISMVTSSDKSHPNCTFKELGLQTPHICQDGVLLALLRASTTIYLARLEHWKGGFSVDSRPGKHTKKHGNSPLKQWVNPLFLWAIFAVCKVLIYQRPWEGLTAWYFLLLLINMPHDIAASSNTYIHAGTEQNWSSTPQDCSCLLATQLYKKSSFLWANSSFHSYHPIPT